MTLLLVSNRLPISLRRIGNRLDVQPNPGGVAAGLAAFYREYKARWFGWPGEVLPSETGEVAARLEKEFDCRPVFLPRKIASVLCGLLERDVVAAVPLVRDVRTILRFRMGRISRGQRTLCGRSRARNEARRFDLDSRLPSVPAASPDSNSRP